MVDPDNRRPVDFDRRREILETLAGNSLTTMSEWRSGAVKLGVVYRLLQLRKELPDLFAKGSYEPIELPGDAHGRYIAFLRRNGEDAVVVAAWLGTPDTMPDASISLPTELAGAEWLNVLADTQAGNTLSAQSLLSDFPVAVLRSSRALTH